jgi:hypothetical protein
MAISTHSGKGSIDIARIRRADIRGVWAALGGGELRGNRGQAFWRGGDGFNVALYLHTGTWHDFVSGDGGDVIALVEMVQGCDFKQACAWLARLVGVEISEPVHRDRTRRPDADWQADLQWALWWKAGAESLAEEILRELPSWSRYRFCLTTFLQSLRAGEATLVGAYRDWRKRSPQLTAALSRWGRLDDAQMQRRLALWIARDCDVE